MCLANVGEDDIFIDSSLFLQCDSNIIPIPVIFGSWFRHAIDQEAPGV